MHAPFLRKEKDSGFVQQSSTGATKTDIVVPVIRFVVVAVGTTANITIIVPRAAAQNYSTLPLFYNN